MKVVLCVCVDVKYVANVLVSVLFSCALAGLTSFPRVVLKIQNHDFYHGYLLMTEPTTFFLLLFDQSDLLFLLVSIYLV